MKSPLKIADVSTTLLAEGKSRRLQAIREKTITNTAQTATPERKSVANSLNPRETEAFRARQLLDQQLTDILATYPPGKKQRFFQLRYGLSEAQLKQQTIKAAFATLQLDNHLVKMDWIGDYRYQPD